MDFFKKASASFGGESDLAKKAESFLGSSKTSAPEISTETPAGKDAAPAADIAPPAADGKGNYSELYGSAQTLYQGLQDKFSGKKSDIGDQEIAGAAAKVLKAAEKSGFAKDGQNAEYFRKAETYLQNYGKPKEGDAVAAVPKSDKAAEAPAEAPAVEAPPPATAAPAPVPAPAPAPADAPPAAE